MKTKELCDACQLLVLADANAVDGKTSEAHVAGLRVEEEEVVHRGHFESTRDECRLAYSHVAVE